MLQQGCTDNQNSPRVDCLSWGSSSRIDPPSMSSNSDSETTLTPSLLALSNFEPDDSPATKKSRFPETDETTLPPSDFIESAISFLGLLRVPVMPVSYTHLTLPTKA